MPISTRPDDPKDLFRLTRGTRAQGHRVQIPVRPPLHISVSPLM